MHLFSSNRNEACSGTARTDAPVVIAIIALPPPLNGQTIVNEKMISFLAGTVDLKTINTSPKSHARSLAYHLRRIAAISKLPFTLFANVFASNRHLYTVIEPGYGIAYNFIAVVSAKVLGYRLVLHHHASSYSKQFSTRFNILATLAGQNAVHVALSDRMAGDMTKLYRSCKRMLVLNNAGVIPNADPNLGKRMDRLALTLGFISNLSLDKGLDTVIRVFEQIRIRDNRVRLALAGPIVDEDARQLLDTVRERYGPDLIEFGPVSGKRKDEFFNRIDLFLFPSRYRFEAQPLVILEALSYGIPVITTRQGYADEIVAPLHTAVDHNDFSAFANQYADRLATDLAFAHTERAAARARFDELAEVSAAQKNDFRRIFEHLE